MRSTGKKFRCSRPRIVPYEILSLDVWGRSLSPREGEVVREAAALWCARLIYFSPTRRGAGGFRWKDPFMRHRDDAVFPVLAGTKSGRPIPHNKVVKRAHALWLASGEADGLPDYKRNLSDYLHELGHRLGYDDREAREEVLVRSRRWCR